jgi:hypothetical protein
MSKRRGGGNPKIRFDESGYYDMAHGGRNCTLAKMGGEMVADGIMGQAQRFDLCANLTHSRSLAVAGSDGQGLSLG